MDTIAVFDFDGTMTKKDSFKDFLFYVFGVAGLCQGIMKNFLSLAGYACGLVTNHEAKEKLFESFFAGWSADKFNHACRSYALEKIDSIIRPKARNKFSWHQERKHHLVIVSASISSWLTPWAIKWGFHNVLATEPEVRNGVLTGRFATPNCYGEEKKRRFLEKYPHRDQYILYVYGDSKGDKELLDIADNPFYRCFQ